MTLALVCGAGVGAGVWLIVRGLYPPRPSLADALAHLRRLPAPVPTVNVETGVGFSARLGRPVADALGGGDRSWLCPRWLRRDLAVLGRSPERHLAEKVTLGLVGFLFVPAVAALLAFGGVRVPLTIPIWGSLVCMVGGFSSRISASGPMRRIGAATFATRSPVSWILLWWPWPGAAASRRH